MKQVNQILADLKTCPHPGKTFIGRMGRGFDLLGDEFLPLPPEKESSQSTATCFCVRVFRPALARFVERFGRLYAQGGGNFHLGQYDRRWMIWVKAVIGVEQLGLTPDHPIRLPSPSRCTVTLSCPFFLNLQTMARMWRHDLEVTSNPPSAPFSFWDSVHARLHSFFNGRTHLRRVCPTLSNVGSFAPCRSAAWSLLSNIIPSRMTRHFATSYYDLVSVVVSAPRYRLLFSLLA